MFCCIWGTEVLSLHNFRKKVFNVTHTPMQLSSTYAISTMWLILQKIQWQKTDSKQKKKKEKLKRKKENWAKQVKAIFPKKKKKKSNPTVTLLCIFGAWYSPLSSVSPQTVTFLKSTTIDTRILCATFLQRSPVFLLLHEVWSFKYQYATSAFKHENFLQ